MDPFHSPYSFLTNDQATFEFWFCYVVVLYCTVLCHIQYVPSYQIQYVPSYQNNNIQKGYKLGVKQLVAWNFLCRNNYFAYLLKNNKSWQFFTETNFLFLCITTYSTLHSSSKKKQAKTHYNNRNSPNKEKVKPCPERK